MPSFLLRLNLLLVAAGGPAAGWALHLVGGALNYAYLDAQGPAATPFRYQITARIYFNREPGSSNPDGSPTLTFRIYNKTTQGLLQVNVARNSFTEITPPLLPGCSLQAPQMTSYSSRAVWWVSAAS